jgi:hypothetical protein
VESLSPFLRKRNFDLMLYGWVSSIRFSLPSATVNDAINSFFRRYKIDEKNYSKAAAEKSYYRMDREFDKCVDEIRSVKE